MMQKAYLNVILQVKHIKLSFIAILSWFLILGEIQDGDHCCWRHRPPAAPPLIKNKTRLLSRSKAFHWRQITIDTLINDSFQNKIKVKVLNFRMPWMMIWKIAKWRTFNILDIFVLFEAMNFSTYSASPVEKRKKLIPYVYLLSTPDLNYLTIGNIKQCLVFNWFLKCVGSRLGIAFTWVNL